jgi:hypothetical protein
MQAELTEMVGSEIYDRFVAMVRERDRLRKNGVPLPHPAVRRRGGRNGSASEAVAVSAEVTA